jgi:ketosteroid isomerase-like protein
VSEENVEIVRSMYALVNEAGDIEAGFGVFDPAVEFEISSRGGREDADFRVLQGVEEMRGAIDEILGPFESVRYLLHEVHDAGDEVVAVLEMLLRPKGSSGEISTGRFAYVFTFRSGRIVRVQDFPEPAEALEAAGLSP